MEKIQEEMPYLEKILVSNPSSRSTYDICKLQILNSVSKNFSGILNIYDSNKYNKHYLLTRCIYKWKLNVKIYPKATLDDYIINVCPDYLKLDYLKYNFINIWLQIYRWKQNVNSSKNLNNSKNINIYQLLNKCKDYTFKKFLNHYIIEFMWDEKHIYKSKKFINGYIMSYVFIYPYKPIRFIINKMLEKLSYHEYINDKNVYLDKIESQTSFYDMLNQIGFDEFLCYGF